MLKSEIIKKLVENYGSLPFHDVKVSVDTILGEIENTLMTGGTVELRGFGVFSTRKKLPRKGHNPRTGEELDIETRYIPCFRAGKVLQKRINPSWAS